MQHPEPLLFILTGLVMIFALVWALALTFYVLKLKASNDHLIKKSFEIEKQVVIQQEQRLALLENEVKRLLEEQYKKNMALPPLPFEL